MIHGRLHVSHPQKHMAKKRITVFALRRSYGGNKVEQ